MIVDITVPAKRCTCDKCGYTWISIAKRKPECCQSRKCRSREWDGQKLRKHINELRLPAARRRGRPRVRARGPLIEDEEP